VHREATRKRMGRVHRAEMELDRATSVAYRTPIRARDARL
jgi:hypothetical protein